MPLIPSLLAALLLAAPPTIGPGGDPPLWIPDVAGGPPAARAPRADPEAGDLLDRAGEMSWRGRYDEESALARRVIAHPRATAAQRAEAWAILTEAHYYKGEPDAVMASARRFAEEWRHATPRMGDRFTVLLTRTYVKAPGHCRRSPASLLDESRRKFDRGDVREALLLAAAAGQRPGASGFVRCRAALLVYAPARAMGDGPHARRLYREFERLLPRLTAKERRLLLAERRALDVALRPAAEGQ